MAESIATLLTGGDWIAPSYSSFCGLVFGAIFGGVFGCKLFEYFHRGVRWRGWLDRGVSYGCCLAVPISLTLVGVVYASGGPEPTAKQVQETYRHHEPAFLSAVRMVAASPPENDDPNARPYESAAFRKLERSIGVRGYQRLPNGEVDLTCWRAIDAWDEKGIAYSPKPPDELVDDLDASIREGRQENIFRLYQHIEGPWYVYDQKSED